MTNEIEDIHEFLEVFSTKYEDISKLSRNIDFLIDANISQTECLYILDFSTNEMTFKKGFKDFLGYEEESMDIELYLNKVHPQDIDLLSKIGKASILHTSANPGQNMDNVLYISFRIQKSNGEYVKVLSQSSVFESDKDGHMVTSLIKVSDISFMEDNSLVKYNFVAENLDHEEFKHVIYGDKYKLFTSRELEIIREIEKGSTNTEIGLSLVISKHTVATHRKKIMKKCGCHSAEELLLFCKNNGVL